MLGPLLARIAGQGQGLGIRRGFLDAGVSAIRWIGLSAGQERGNCQEPAQAQGHEQTGDVC